MFKIIVLFSLVALSVALLGGFETVDVDDEEVVAAANHAAKGLSKQFAGKFHHRLYKVLKAKRQVVAGTNFQMDIVVGQTTCKKDEVEFENTSDCDFKDGISTYKKCTVLVFKDLSGNHKLVSTGCILASKKDL
ncbi:u37-Nephitoxin-Nsp1b_1 [Caerostris extrusa]|uniref:U37-Nephitoxin-Nsp1b_1 n=1 Tax=Caerostris extrusa TaxID=172846 RepID=A0AAV4SEH3_CAEEX|nr:u37-Nephitoxin-Nsp1b_1 [Caerostris extrusa]